MHIGWIMAGADGFGVRQATRGMVGALVRRGVRVTLICLGPGDLRDFESTGAEVLIVGVEDAPWIRKTSFLDNFKQYLDQGLYIHRASRALADKLCGRDLDLLHFRNQNLVGLVGSTARRLGLPSCWHMPNALGEGYLFGINRRLYQFECYFRRVLPIGNSAYTADSFGHWPVRPEILPCGTDPERFNPARVKPFSREEFGLPGEALVFGIFARLVPYKGQELFLRALARIGPQTRPVHLLVLGGPVDGDFARSLVELAQKLGVQDRFHLHPEVEEIERCYDLTDVGVNSRIDAEPHGLSVVESMMMGRPVLVHALGGPQQTVLDGVTGWHMPEATLEGYVAGLERALRDQARWAEMGRAAREHALASYTTQRSAEKFLAILERRFGWAGLVDRGL
jgi:glycosyltransferase involved in cell wall biosynthesis